MSFVLDVGRSRKYRCLFTLRLHSNSVRKTTDERIDCLDVFFNIRSIARTAGVDYEKLKEMTKTMDLNFEVEERELKLAKCINRYADVFTRVIDELLMHFLCDYMYQLATTFTEFYDRCYCVEKNQQTGEIKINYRRMVLCEATANVLKKCFEILGIQPLDRM